MEDNLEINTDETEMPEADIAGESKADKFKRLGEARMNKALTAISRLGALSGSAYEYTEEQVDNMFGALQGMLDETKAKFEKKKKKESVGFKF